MEADWAAEIGPGVPQIDADWPGYVDLRAEPGRMAEVGEAAEYPPMRTALEMLNAPESAVFTGKCDVWALDAAEIDRDEFGCGGADAGVGVASYADVMARGASAFRSFEEHERWARATVERLRAEALPCGRVDLVIRVATAGGFEGFGITLYAAGCGADGEAAKAAWARVLRAAAAATMREAAPTRASSSIG